LGYTFFSSYFIASIACKPVIWFGHALAVGIVFKSGEKAAPIGGMRQWRVIQNWIMCRHAVLTPRAIGFQVYQQQRGKNGVCIS